MGSAAAPGERHQAQISDVNENKKKNVAPRRTGGQPEAHRQKLGCVFDLSLQAALGLQDELILNDTQILT